MPGNQRTLLKIHEISSQGNQGASLSPLHSLTGWPACVFNHSMPWVLYHDSSSHFPYIDPFLLPLLLCHSYVGQGLATQAHKRTSWGELKPNGRSAKSLPLNSKAEYSSYHMQRTPSWWQQWTWTLTQMKALTTQKAKQTWLQCVAIGIAAQMS